MQKKFLEIVDEYTSKIQNEQLLSDEDFIRGIKVLMIPEYAELFHENYLDEHTEHKANALAFVRLNNLICEKAPDFWYEAIMGSEVNRTDA